MLNYFASLDFLISLHKLVTNFINGSVDPVLDLAKMQERDTLLTDPVWGTRRTSENWANYAWPILKDLQVALTSTIGLRQAGQYIRPGVLEYLRGVEQFSLEWATPDEEKAFEEAIALIGRVGRCLDDLLAEDELSRIDDFTLAVSHDIFTAQSGRVQQFRIREDIRAVTGEIPPRTGVYIAADDPHATPQFAFCEGEGRALRQANTFNEIGVAALAHVGRRDLWRDDRKMLEFAKLPRYAALFHDEIVLDGDEYEELASSAVAKAAFTSHSATWYFLEPIEGAFEQSEIPFDEQDLPQPGTMHRIVGGEACVIPGYYFTPAMPGARRYFSNGELTPAFDARYGQTFWQWDQNQEPNRL